jgi:hypothetical protein
MSKAAELAALIGGQKALGDKNLLINGDMQIAQRQTSLAYAHDGTTNGYVMDRWRFTLGGTHEQFDGTYAQVDDHPLTANGKSLKWTTGTAESSYDADEYLYFVQIIEAQNLQRLQFGNSNAKSVTLSFYVKSSITGTYAVNLYKPDSTTRVINKTYAISSADTWEKKTITFPADTDSGAGIVNDNGQGFYVSWHIAAGSNATGGGSNGAWKDYAGLSDWADGQATNAVATTASATWQMAQCQLEVGEAATAFEHENIGTALEKCQRYYYKISGDANLDLGVGVCNTTTLAAINCPFAFPMRAKPTALEQSGTVTHYDVLVDNSVVIGNTVPVFQRATTVSGTVGFQAASGLTAGEGTIMRTRDNAAYLAWSAEL